MWAVLIWYNCIRPTAERGPNEVFGGFKTKNQADDWVLSNVEDLLARGGSEVMSWMLSKMEPPNSVLAQRIHDNVELLHAAISIEQEDLANCLLEDMQKNFDDMIDQCELKQKHEIGSGT